MRGLAEPSLHICRVPADRSGMPTHHVDPIRPSGGLRRLRAGLPIEADETPAGPTGPQTRDQFIAGLDAAIARAVREERTVLVMRVQIRPLPGGDADDRGRIDPGIKQRLTQADTGVVAYAVAPDEIIAFVPSLRRRSDGEETVALVVEALTAPIVHEDLPHYLSPRIGAALLDRENPSSETLLEGTRLALAEADRSSPGMMFHPYQRVRHQRHSEMETELRAAVLRNETSVAFQPIVHMASGKITAMEAFARWFRAGKGQVPTIDFIRSAEELGVMHQLGRQVLEKALFQTADWVDSGLVEDITLWLNVSPAEILHPEFSKMVGDAIAVNERVRIGIELSPMPPNDDRHIASVIRSLVARGARASIGDFGVGYIDLSMLHQLPFDSVTLDRSLIRQIASNEQAADLLKILVDLGTRLGLSTTAAGIETREQADMLAQMGCTNAQGYFLARPLLADEMTDLLVQHRSGGHSLLQNN